MNPNAPNQQVILRTSPDGEQHFTSLHLEKLDQTGACNWWRTSMHLTMPLTYYRFLIISEDAAYWYNASGLHTFSPTDAEDFRILADYQAPGWLKNSVF